MPIPVALTGNPGGGGSIPFHLSTAATTNPTVIKVGAGKVMSWYITNTNAAIRYICFHDTNKAPVAGQNISRKFGIPASGAANVDFGIGLQFNYGIAITTVAGTGVDSDATVVSAQDLIINIEYV